MTSFRGAMPLVDASRNERRRVFIKHLIHNLTMEYINGNVKFQKANPAFTFGFEAENRLLLAWSSVLQSLKTSKLTPSKSKRHQTPCDYRFK